MIMKKNSTPFWICGLFLAAAIGFFANAALLCREPPPPPRVPAENHAPDIGFAGKKHRDFKRELDSALGLSKRQIALLDSNALACDSIRKRMKRNIRDKERQLQNLLDADTIDEAKLQVVRMELLILNEKRLDARISDIRFFQSVLAPEQKKMLKEMSRGENKFSLPPPKQ